MDKTQKESKAFCSANIVMQSCHIELNLAIFLNINIIPNKSVVYVDYTRQLPKIRGILVKVNQSS